MGKLSASILSADFAHLADAIAVVEETVDVLHIDVMDGRFVPPLTFGAPIVRALRPVTRRTLHGHLMVAAPADLFPELAAAGMEVASFHVEAVDDPRPTFAAARDAGMRVGITVSPETPVEAVFPFLDEVDDVMVMSVRPGWSGQSFIPGSLERLASIRAELDRRGVGADLEIDGGVKLDNARRCVEAGATVLVAASAIFQAPDPAAAAAELRALVRDA
ncbi:MAG: ribulose-phosphate 3-epimerase [Actinomycetota bacterium]